MADIGEKLTGLMNTMSSVGSQAGNWLAGGTPSGGGGGAPVPAGRLGMVPPSPDPSGSSFSPKNALSLAGIIGQVVDQIQKMRMQSNLQDPNYIARQIQKLQSAEAPGLYRALAPGIEGGLAERGQSTAPGMIAEAEFQGVGADLAQLAGNEYFSGVGAAQGENTGSMGFANIANLIEKIYGDQGATA